MAAISLGGGVSFAATPSYSVDGKFTISYQISAPEYSVRKITTAGVDGSAIRRAGFRGRKISVMATYVSSSYNGVISAIDADFTTLSNVAFTCTIGGVVFPSCELLSASFDEVHGVGSRFFTTATFSILQNNLV